MAVVISEFSISSRITKEKKVPFLNLKFVFTTNKAKFHIDKIKSSHARRGFKPPCSARQGIPCGIVEFGIVSLRAKQ